MHRQFKSLFVGQTDSTLLQLFRYTVVGGLAFVVDYGSLFLLREFLGIHYLWAAAIAFILGLATNYYISIRWVFDKRNVQNKQVEFFIFALLGILGLGINELVMFILTSVVGLHYLVSKLISTGVTYGWNFASRKVLLFSVSSEEPQASETAITAISPSKLEA
jgi:putative flippase GtrA